MRRWWIAACVGALVSASVRDAQACGGTFCDAGPTAMPVEQTGETILFVLDDDAVEAHIQIQVDPETEAERFAWIIPVLALPEFAVGSQPLFDRMLAGSVPAYATGVWRELCDPGTGGEGGCTDGDDGSDDDAVTLDLGAGHDAPDVVDRRMVGAFEITVLEGGTADSVAQWLVDNDYQTDDVATPILGEYLAEGFMFVAVKLATDAEAADVHPIVLRIPGDEPCVPIRLTRIAAQDDLRLRVLFLADARVVPDNWPHVVFNALKLDWLSFGANYDALVTQAVDAAGGRAWVTEYAGASTVVNTFGLVDERWDANAFIGLDATAAVTMMLHQGVLTCEACPVGHPLADGLVRQFLTPPADVDAEAFWACPSCDPFALERASFDDVGFVEAFRQRIIDPAIHAEELFVRWPFLTRMFTTISPEEMLEDPTFVANPDAMPESTLTRTGLLATWCDGTRMYRLPDSRIVALPQPAWPMFPRMPPHERIERWSSAGAPMVVVDRRDEIDGFLHDWNAYNGGVRMPPSAASVCDDGGDAGGWESVGFDAVDIRPPEPRDGCGCRSSGPGAVAAFGLMLVGMLGLRRR